MLLACMGLGALGGALLLPRLRKTTSVDIIAVGASLLFALAMVALASAPDVIWLGPGLFAGGAAWMAMLSILNLGAQRSAAGWVKARALSVYLVVMYGAMAGGSMLWGRAAATWGLPTVLLGAAAGMVLASAAALRWRLDCWPELDLSPSALALANPAIDAHADHGPVMISVEYLVAAADAPAFQAAAAAMRDVRRRGGALSWAVYQDTAAPERYCEVWLTASWLEHQRQHERFSANDLAIQHRVHAFHRGAGGPRVTHLIAPRPA
jgi:hypothetical protein